MYKIPSIIIKIHELQHYLKNLNFLFIKLKIHTSYFTAMTLFNSLDFIQHCLISLP